MPEVETLVSPSSTPVPGGRFEVREPVPDDAPAVRDVMSAAWEAAAKSFRGEGSERLTPSAVRGRFRNDSFAIEAILRAAFAPRVTSLVQRVALDAGRIVGYLRVARHLSSEELRTVVVLPDSQGKGAGYAMFREASGELRDPSRALRASYPAGDEHVRKVLEKWGFSGRTRLEYPFHEFPGLMIPAVQVTWNHPANHA